MAKMSYTDVFCPQQIDEDWGCCHSAMFLTIVQKLLCRWKGSVVKIWNTWCQKKLLLMKRVYHGKCKPRVGCPLSRVGGRLHTIEENALIRLCKSAKCSVLHVSCTRHTALYTSWNCTDMARQSGKDERKDVLISGSSFPSGCYWLIMGLDWSPPSALTLGGSKIITKMRKTGIFKMQP